MVSLSRPLADFGNPRAGKPRGNWWKTEGQLKYAKYILMMGNIGPSAIFEVKIGNMQNLFYMMGNSRQKLTFMLNL